MWFPVTVVGFRRLLFVVKGVIHARHGLDVSRGFVKDEEARIELGTPSPMSFDLAGVVRDGLFEAGAIGQVVAS